VPENAVALSGVQLGVEATPGTSVAANKLLNYLDWQPSPTINTNTFRPMGSLVPTAVTPGQDFTEYTLAGAGSYSEFPYIGCSLLKNVSPTTVDTSAREWLFEPGYNVEETLKTYTVEVGNNVRAGKTTYSLITGCELTFNRTDGVTISGGSAIGQNWQDNITLTPGPTATQDKPILPTHLDVYLDTTSGGLGGTKLTRDFNVVFRFTDRSGAIWPINSALASYAAHVATVPTVEMELNFEYDTQGAASSFTPIRAGTTRFIRASALSTELAGAATRFYDLRVDMAAKCSAISFDETDGVRTVTSTWQAVYDSTWAKFISIRNTNQLAAL
jgi:hypothetical protein